MVFATPIPKGEQQRPKVPDAAPERERETLEGGPGAGTGNGKTVEDQMLRAAIDSGLVAAEEAP